MISLKNRMAFTMVAKCDGPHKYIAPSYKATGMSEEACKGKARDIGWRFHRNCKCSCPRCVKSGAARKTGYREVQKHEDGQSDNSNT